MIISCFDIKSFLAWTSAVVSTLAFATSTALVCRCFGVRRKKHYCFLWSMQSLGSQYIWLISNWEAVYERIDDCLCLSLLCDGLCLELVLNHRQICVRKNATNLALMNSFKLVHAMVSLKAISLTVSLVSVLLNCWKWNCSAPLFIVVASITHPKSMTYPKTNARKSLRNELTILPREQNKLNRHSQHCPSHDQSWERKVDNPTKHNNHLQGTHFQTQQLVHNALYLNVGTHANFKWVMEICQWSIVELFRTKHAIDLAYLRVVNSSLEDHPTKE